MELIKQENSNKGLQTTKENWLIESQKLPVKANQSAIDVCKLGTPKLAQLARLIGPEAAILTVSIMLNNFLTFLDAKWNKVQINEVERIITDNYAHWTIAHWKLFFEKAKVGVFDTTYGSISTNTFCLWMKVFSAEVEDANEKADIAADYQRRNAPRPEDPDAVYVTKEQVAEALEKLKQEFDKAETKQNLQSVTTSEERRAAQQKIAQDYAISQGLNWEAVLQNFKDSKLQHPDR